VEKLTNLNFFDEVYYEINKLPDDLVHNIDVITIGFDTEYQQKSENERIILSYQASIALPYYEKYLNLIFITNNYQKITINQFLLTSIELAYKLMLNKKFNYNQTTQVVLVAHFSQVDLSAFSRAKTFLRKLINIRKTFTSKQKSDKSKIKGIKIGNFDVIIRDTYLLSAGNSLAELGKIINLKKVKLSKTIIANMEKLLKENKEKFIKYAIRDSEIALVYSLYLANSLNKNVSELPVTLASLAAQKAVEYFQYKFGWNKKDINEKFRLLIKVKDSDQKRHYPSRYLQPKPGFETPLMLSTFCLYGGYNQSFRYGFFSSDKKFYDLDLNSAYPVAMSLLKQLDTKNQPEVLTKGTDLSKINFDFTTPLFAHIEFEFPKNIKYPCIPIKDIEGGHGLIFPLRGETYASGPEIFVACLLGAKIVVKSIGFIFKTLNNYILKDLIKEMIKEREEAKKLYGKNSIQQLILKIRNNSLYGKLCQGLVGKKAFSPSCLKSRLIPESPISMPVYASMVTAITRAFLVLTLNLCECNNFKIYSATTDGFLVEGNPLSLLELKEPPKNKKSFKLYKIYKQLYQLFAEANDFLKGNNSVWEVKGYSEYLFNSRTRLNAQISLSSCEISNAAVSMKTLHKKNTPERSLEILSKFLSRDETGSVLEEYETLTTIRQFFLKNKELGVKQPRSVHINLEFDFKQKPKNWYVTRISDEIFKELKKFKNAYKFDKEMLCIETEPFQNIKEFKAWRKSFDLMKEKLNPETIQQIKDRAAFYYSAAEHVKFTRKTKALAFLKLTIENKLPIPKKNILRKTSEFFKVDLNPWDLKQVKRQDFMKDVNLQTFLQALGYEEYLKLVLHILTPYDEKEIIENFKTLGLIRDTTCPHCQGELKLKEKNSHYYFRCPRCKHDFSIFSEPLKSTKLNLKQLYQLILLLVNKPYLKPLQLASLLGIKQKKTAYNIISTLQPLIQSLNPQIKELFNLPEGVGLYTS